MPAFKKGKRMGFITSLFSKKALALETVKTQERLYFQAKRQYPEKEPHELLMSVYLGRRQVIGDDINSEGMQLAADTETEMFACLPEPNNVRALAMRMLYKERHLNKNLYKHYPSYQFEYNKLLQNIESIKERNPKDYERLYRLHNPKLAVELFGKVDESQQHSEFLEQLEKAKEVIKDNGIASTAILQRRMSISYGTAARLIEALEEQKLISIADKERPREIYF